MKTLLPFFLFTLISFCGKTQFNNGNHYYTCGSTYHLSFSKDEMQAAYQAQYKANCGPDLIPILDFSAADYSIADPYSSNSMGYVTNFNTAGAFVTMDVIMPCRCGTPCYTFQINFYPLSAGLTLDPCMGSFYYIDYFTVCGNPPCESCITSEVFVDCDNSSCVKLTNACESKCVCLTVNYTDQTSSIHNMQIPANSFIKLCFGKQISSVQFNETTCTTCSTNGRSSVQLNQQHPLSLKAYPNPANTVLMVDGIPINAAIKIINSASIVFPVKKIGLKQFDISNLKPGLYILQVKTNNGKIVTNTKFIKQ